MGNLNVTEVSCDFSNAILSQKSAVGELQESVEQDEIFTSWSSLNRLEKDVFVCESHFVESVTWQQSVETIESAYELLKGEALDQEGGSLPVSSQSLQWVETDSNIEIIVHSNSSDQFYCQLNGGEPKIFDGDAHFGTSELQIPFYLQCGLSQSKVDLNLLATRDLLMNEQDLFEVEISDVAQSVDLPEIKFEPNLSSVSRTTTPNPNKPKWKLPLGIALGVGALAFGGIAFSKQNQAIQLDQRIDNLHYYGDDFQTAFEVRDRLIGESQAGFAASGLLAMGSTFFVVTGVLPQKNKISKERQP